ncbi:MAG: hypothetical protein ACRCXY_07660 [Fusobacteriaceae bacterium]
MSVKDLTIDFYEPNDKKISFKYNKIKTKLDLEANQSSFNEEESFQVEDRLLLVQNFYIYSENGKEALKLPLPPESYKIVQNQENRKTSTLKYGDINVLAKILPRKISFQCILPDNTEFHYDFLRYYINKWKVIEFFREMQASGKPYLVVITNTPIGTSEDFRAIVSELSYKTEGNCVKLNITLEEFINIENI